MNDEKVLRQKRVEAEQVAAEAKVQVDAAIEHARGESLSTLLNASARAHATESRRRPTPSTSGWAAA